MNAFKISLLAAALLFSAGSSFASEIGLDNCAIFTAERPRFCVQNEAFSRYDLKELAAAGTPITVSLRGTRLDAFDLKDIASAGPLTVVANEARLSKYDLLSLAQAGITVWITGPTSQLSLSRYDLIELASAGVKIAIQLDNNKFSPYELTEIAAHGSFQVAYRSSAKLLSKYDLKQAVDGRVDLYLLVDDATFSKYDLMELLRSGLRLN